MEVLFTLLAERYERGSVLTTSNLPFSQWEAILKDCPSRKLVAPVAVGDSARAGPCPTLAETSVSSMPSDRLGDPSHLDDFHPFLPRPADAPPPRWPLNAA